MEQESDIPRGNPVTSIAARQLAQTSIRLFAACHSGAFSQSLSAVGPSLPRAPVALFLEFIPGCAGWGGPMEQSRIAQAKEFPS